MRKTTLFFHPFILTPRGLSRMTFAFEPVFVDNKLMAILASHSICSVDDQFCKKTGRELALQKIPVEIKPRNVHNYVNDILKSINKPYYEAQKSSNWCFLTVAFME